MAAAHLFWRKLPILFLLVLSVATIVTVLNYISASYTLATTIHKGMESLASINEFIKVKDDDVEKFICKPKTKIAFAKTHKTGSSTLQNLLLRYGVKNDLVRISLWSIIFKVEHTLKLLLLIWRYCCCLSFELTYWSKFVHLYSLKWLFTLFKCKISVQVWCHWPYDTLRYLRCHPNHGCLMF